MKLIWVDLTVALIIFLFGCYTGHRLAVQNTQDPISKIEFKDRVVEKVVYRDKVENKVVNRVIHVYDRKKDKITTIEEIENDSSSNKSATTTGIVTHEQSLVSQKDKRYSLGAFYDGQGTKLDNFRPYASVNLFGPLNLMGYTDLTFRDYGIGLSISF